MSKEDSEGFMSGLVGHSDLRPEDLLSQSNREVSKQQKLELMNAQKDNVGKKLILWTSTRKSSGHACFY